jgi:hypothetical protein
MDCRAGQLCLFAIDRLGLKNFVFRLEKAEGIARQNPSTSSMDIVSEVISGRGVTERHQ